MNFCIDKYTKYFCIFLLSFVPLLFLIGLGIHNQQMEAAKSMFLSHNNTIATSLINQGISEEVIAVAITNTSNSQAGADLLKKFGITKNSCVIFFPAISSFQEGTTTILWIVGILLLFILYVGTFLFLWQREQLYQQTSHVVREYSEGNFSQHLPQLKEGTLFHIFTSIETLATMLQAENENQYKAKEFLKHTISDISHQLKTPLAALFLYQEIMEKEPENIATIIEFTDKMGIALHRMDQLIQSLLKITRLDAGNIVFDKKSHKVSKLIARSINDLTTRAANEAKEIKIEGNADDIVLCDMHWTAEAVGNIIKNALDHTVSGGIIQISWIHTPAMLRIIIKDNGKGIPPEDIHHIFKRFYRSKNSMDRQGVGLGLPLAQSIVEGQGGIISVQSEHKKGTTFTLSFLTEL